MLIGIDGNEANVLRRVGSNIFAFELLQALALSPGDAHYTVYLKNPPLPDLPPARLNWQYRVIKPGKLWTQWRLPLDLYWPMSRPDVFFTPGHYAPRFCPIPTVVTILDLAFLHFPALFLKNTRGVTQLSAWTKYSVTNASHVLAISNATKNSLIEAYSLPPAKISVVYPGIDQQFFTPPSAQAVKAVRERYQLKRAYLLYLGTLQPRKNLDRLLQAFESLPPKGSQLDLVLAGGTGWLMDEFMAKVIASKKAAKIRLLGYVDREDLPALYASATATALVGLEEGFGLPPAEAMAVGGIVIAAKTGSLPEVVGEAGIMVDPYSVTSIRHGIIAALSLTEAARAKRARLGQAHVKQFKWLTSANQVRRILYDLALSR